MTAAATPAPPPAPAGEDEVSVLVRALRTFPHWLKDNLPRTIATAFGTAVVAYIVNVWLMAVRYDGFNSPPNSVATSQDNLFQGTLFWSGLTIVLFSLVGYRRAVGGKQFWADLRGLPRGCAALVRTDGAAAVSHLLWGAASGMVATLVLGPAVGAVMALGLFAATPTVLGNVLSTLAYRAINRGVKPLISSGSTSPGPGMVGCAVGVLGAAMALTLGYFLVDTGWKVITAVGLAIAAIVVGKRAQDEQLPPAPAAAVIVWLLAIGGAVIYAIVHAAPALADDGGWRECGSNMSQWLTDCAGATTVRIASLVGAASSAGGATVGNFVGSVVGSMRPGGLGGPGGGGAASGGGPGPGGDGGAAGSLGAAVGDATGGGHGAAADAGLVDAGAARHFVQEMLGDPAYAQWQQATGNKAITPPAFEDYMRWRHAQGLADATIIVGGAVAGVTRQAGGGRPEPDDDTTDTATPAPTAAHTVAPTSVAGEVAGAAHAITPTSGVADGIAAAATHVPAAGGAGTPDLTDAVQRAAHEVGASGPGDIAAATQVPASGVAGPPDLTDAVRRAAHEVGGSGSGDIASDIAAAAQAVAPGPADAGTLGHAVGAHLGDDRGAGATGAAVGRAVDGPEVDATTVGHPLGATTGTGVASDVAAAAAQAAPPGAGASSVGHAVGGALGGAHDAPGAATGHAVGDALGGSSPAADIAHAAQQLGAGGPAVAHGVAGAADHATGDLGTDIAAAAAQVAPHPLGAGGLGHAVGDAIDAGPAGSAGAAVGHAIAGEAGAHGFDAGPGARAPGDDIASAAAQVAPHAPTAADVGQAVGSAVGPDPGAAPGATAAPPSSAVVAGAAAGAAIGGVIGVGVTHGSEPPTGHQEWLPTHRIPAPGLTSVAGPEDPTTYDLAAGLPVQLVGRSGDLALVLASNGWQGWVDGRGLIPV